MTEVRPQARTVKHRLGEWFGDGPRRHGEPIDGRSVSYLELLYDLVFVVLVGQASRALATQSDWRGAAGFVPVFGLVWIAWINGTMYHELHGREDGRSRFYVFAQMCVLAVLAVFTGRADGVDGTPFALTYATLLALLWWQWYEVRRRDLPEDRPVSTPYLTGLLVTIVAMLATAWLDDAVRLATWTALVVCWVVLGTVGFFVASGRSRNFLRPSESLVERLALFVIIVLGETVVGVVNGIANPVGVVNGVAETQRDALTVATGVIGLCVGFGLWWNYFDVVGPREPRERPGAVATWFFGHLPQTGAIVAAGAAMVGLVAHAHDPRTPTGVAGILTGAVATSLLLLAAQSASVEQHDGLDAGVRALVYGVGAVIVLALGALDPAPWLLAALVVAVLNLTWLSTFVPPARD